MKRSYTISNKVYKYVHEQDVWILTNLTGRDFENKWLKIEHNGKIIVKGSFSKIIFIKLINMFIKKQLKCCI